jgi:two-component system chemotaxis response regulator CheY
MPRKPLILHVDDDQAMRDFVEETLTKAGMDMREAGEVLEGIQLALAQPPDLILLDLHMPTSDGYEACLAFRAVPDLRGIPIIMLTGMHDKDHMEKASSCGVAEYITKPFEAARLISAVRKWLPAG